ncbi:MAG TPA: hypothetical protein VMR21_15470, partial [Vicinamibacteria bacterium]|nr:hypothetical protein [Vicinamibacteria bacterium]
MKGGSAALAVAAVLAGCGGGSAELSRLRTEHGEMQRRFDSLVDRDPVVREALEAGGGVAIGLRPSLVEDVLQQVSARYLDRVVLDLPLERTVHETGELRVKTFLGHVTAGTWTLEATIHRV